MNKKEKTPVSKEEELSSSIKKLRRQLRLSQSEFWPPLGISQSCGSRYENNRPVPAPTRKLLWLFYTLTPNNEISMESLSWLKGEIEKV